MKSIGIIESNYHKRLYLKESICNLTSFKLLFSVLHEKDLCISNFSQELPDLIVVGYDNNCITNLLECTRFVHDNFPKSKIMVMTQDPDTKFLFTCLQIGIQGLTVYHDDPIKLLYTIHELFGTGAYICSRTFKKLKETFENTHKQIHSFTKKEKCIIDYVSIGKSAKEIGKIMNVSIPTVNFHLQNIYRKIDVHTKAELFNWLTNVNKSNYHTDFKCC